MIEFEISVLMLPVFWCGLVVCLLASVPQVNLD